MKVSVIVPTFNKAPRLNLMLASAVCQDFDLHEVEILLIDDGSIDETEQIVEKYRNRLNLQYLRKNHGGRSFARNEGIRDAKGEIVIFSDDDVIWGKSFLISHYQRQKEQGPCVVHGQIRSLPFVKFFENPTTGSLYAGMGSKLSLNRLRSRCISEEDITHYFEQKVHQNSNLSTTEQMIFSIFEQDVKSLQWLGCTGANFSAPLEDLKAIHGFDEGFGLTWGFEDFELGYRLQALGREFLYSVDAVNYHLVHFRQTLEDELETSFHYFYSLHPDESLKNVYEFLSGKIDGKFFLQRSGY